MGGMCRHVSGQGGDCLLPVLTICLQTERGSEIESEGQRTLRNTVELRHADGWRRDSETESSGCSINSGCGWGSCRGCTAGRPSSTPAWSVLIASVVTTLPYYTRHPSLTSLYRRLYFWLCVRTDVCDVLHFHLRCYHSVCFKITDSLVYINSAQARFLLEPIMVLWGLNRLKEPSKERCISGHVTVKKRVVNNCHVALWFLCLPPSAALTFSPSECEWGWAMWAYVLERN